MKSRTTMVSAMLAATLLGMTYDQSASKNKRTPPPPSTREKQANNKYRRRKGKQ